MVNILVKTIWNRIEEKIISHDNGDNVYLEFVKRIFYKTLKDKKIEFAYYPLEKFRKDLINRIYEEKYITTRDYLSEKVIKPVFEEFFIKIKKNIKFAQEVNDEN